MDWIHLAQDRDRWRTLLNMAMHVPGVPNAWYSTTCATVLSPNGNPIPEMSYPGWKWEHSTTRG